jgi:hypothetical protein
VKVYGGADLQIQVFFTSAPLGGGEWSVFFALALLRRVSGQLQVPAALPPWKAPTLAIGCEAGWATKPVGTILRVKILYRTGTRTPNGKK